MPFKLRLKKSKQQYNVASKSVYVITVELLDNAQLECTLTSESTGRDCMANVCQRLGLQQGDLFGLRYVSRRSYPKIRWVDLERPLKKQLERYATDCGQNGYLYLCVMFYVNDVSLLEDEVTRYHYFLQLKLDVVEGRLRANCEQAIVLASYALQARPLGSLLECGVPTLVSCQSHVNDAHSTTLEFGGLFQLTVTRSLVSFLLLLTSSPV